MNTGREWFYSQGIAVFLIVFGAFCVGLGSHYNWAELKTLGAGITGAGIQAITAQIKQTLTNKQGGTINVNPEPETQP